MKDEYLNKIVKGPIFLLEGDDGMIYGNSQALAKELLRVRLIIREIKRLIEQHNFDTEGGLPGEQFAGMEEK